MRIRIAALATALTATLLTAGAACAQDAAAGANVFKRCAICHSVVPGQGSTVGPHLNGVVGRKAGSVPKYMYSKAMATSGLTWDTATLDRYLTKPSATIPGNKMAFMGLPNAKDRQDVIAYLATMK